MAEPLWRWDELVAATQGVADGKPTRAIRGVSIDTRTLEPGDLFVALSDARDGHAFVPDAFKARAAAAVVSNAFARSGVKGPLLRVEDPLHGLEALARASRIRSNARMIAVTGSVGKTGVKEMLRLALGDVGPTHASEKSYNNHWGVPLSLARLPRDAAYAVFEIGMNHAGEILPLSQMVRPHLALITTVEAVHLGHFGSVDEIGEAKAEVFAGLVPGEAAILPRDNPHFELLRTRAAAAGARILTFGFHEEADFRALKVELGPRGSAVIAGYGSQRLPYRIGAPGEHYVANSLAVLAAVHALGADLMRCLPALARVTAPPGRGARTMLTADGGEFLLIDESYNANPASVRAALAAMATTSRETFPRRIAVLGDMLELGQSSADLHRGLKDAIEAAGVDLVFACGAMMKELFESLSAAQRGEWAADSAQLAPSLLAAVRAGDVVMIKGSLGSRMAPLVETLLTRYRPQRGGE